MMEQTLATPLPIADLARHLGLSPRSLQMQFQQALGMTAQAHYLDLRLSEARRLVAETDLPLTDIALATGFAAQSSFARAFRRAFGTSARSLRQQAVSPL